MYRKVIRYYALLLLIFIFTILGNGCEKQNRPKDIQKEFDHFINDMFIQEVQSDTLMLNYSLAQPENFGINYSKSTLGEYNIEHMYEGLSLSENYLKRLTQYDYEELSKEQKLTYDILSNYLKNDLEFGKYLYYIECLGPTTGIQAQLPILLAEYNFYSKEDIDRYIELLPCVYDYFKDIVEFEKEKSKKGLFMDDAVADRIIEQCKAFIADPKNNFLIGYFNQKVRLYEGLTKEEILTYQEANQNGVLNYIIPAYEMIIQCLKDLKGSGINPGGLYNYPEGQSYYECLARFKTGSEKSMEDMAKMLDVAIGKGILNITTLTMSDALIVDKYQSFTSFPITDPEEILNDLKTDIREDFPEPVPVNCQIKYVHESLSEYLSPAMYLVPALDNYTNNNIYINGNDNETLSKIYTTVAHEGYPGHLYQCVYFRNQKPAPIRNLMDFLGYDEGWATYVEMYSYQLAGIDKNLADFLKHNNIVILCMYARTDIGIHYEGWSKKQAVSYIMNFVGDENVAESIYSILLEEPAIYLPYAVGYLEIMELREKAEKELQDDFVAKEFHKFLLDIGPAGFGIIDNHLDIWIGNKVQRR
ncbi:DUF885 domain-containing protein [Mobilitalea sibirica]|uniref:DUF885 domain-containing protein n=1 Tax=Mobilitalea sibirica TaxID=1462919 RepID=A0A8J7HBE7_9FIRM|nr:DUF885 domain-containing protein [Mobilitalea sibirica]MBH1941006.1 DUF885 domain-containing protein [Mobilitalea sibirica]